MDAADSERLGDRGAAMNRLRIMNVLARLRGWPPIVPSTVRAPSDDDRSVVLDVAADPPVPRRTRGLESSTGVVFERRETSGGRPKDLKLDVLVPTGPGPFPLVVYISGGGFMASVRRAAARQRGYVASHGFVVASVEHRTVGDGATWDDAVSDVKSAIRYLRAHAAQYRIDPRRVATWGESAGGYMATMTAVTNDVASLERGGHQDVPSRVDAAVSFFGGSDLSAIARGFDDASVAASQQPDWYLARWILGSGGGVLAQFPESVAQANPATHVRADSPALLLFHGDDDRLISPFQTATLHDAALSAGADCVRYVVRGAGHGILGDNAELWNRTGVLDLTVDFLTRHLTPAA
jgi:acetyl esterase/lipase